MKNGKISHHCQKRISSSLFACWMAGDCPQLPCTINCVDIKKWLLFSTSFWINKIHWLLIRSDKIDNSCNQGRNTGALST